MTDDRRPDFYYENGYKVLTAEFLLRRGFCCGNGCRHCPYVKEQYEKSEKAIDGSGKADGNVGDQAE